MQCPHCGRETTSPGRYCIYCGGILQIETSISPQPLAGGETLSLEEELDRIAFALSEVETMRREKVDAPSALDALQGALLARQSQAEGRMVRLLAALPPSEAASELARYVAVHPRTGRARLELGRVYQGQGLHAAAAAQYWLASALEAGQPEPHQRLAQLAEALGQKAQAYYEHHAFLQMERDAARRQDALAKLRSLEAELFPGADVAQGASPAATPEGLEYLVGVIYQVAEGRRQGSALFALQSLASRYARRLDALRHPAPPVAEAATAATSPALRGTAAAATVPMPRQAPIAPLVQREPFDWGGFWSALFSARSLTALLGFGVLLVTVSTLVLLVSIWRGAKAYADVWPAIQATLAGQFVMFLVSGYIIKERLKLHLSGLAVITIAALWVPLNLGSYMFKLFGPQINAARAAAGGSYPAIPGIGVPLDLPLYAWLIVAAVSAPVWGVLTYRFRGHLLAHGTVAFIGATVVLFVALMGIQVQWPVAFGWEWPLASLALLTMPLLLGWRWLRSSSLRDMVEPMFWTAQGILAGVVVAVATMYLTGTGSGYSLAFALASGTGLCLLARRFSSTPAYEYAAAFTSVAALLSLALELGLWQKHYFDAVLMVAGTGYILAGWLLGRSQDIEQAKRLVGLPLTPANVTGYLLAGAAVAWPTYGEPVHAGVLYAGAGLAALSARRWDRTAWTYLANALLGTAVVATLAQADRDVLPMSYWGVALAMLAWVYLAEGLALRRRPDHAQPAFIGALAASAASLAWLLAYPSVTTALATIPVTAGLYACLAVLAHSGKDTALLGLATTVVKSADVSLGSLRPGVVAATAFMTVAAVLAPIWTALLIEHLGLSATAQPNTVLGWAFVFALAGHLLLGRFDKLYRLLFLGLGIALGAISAIISLAFYVNAIPVSGSQAEFVPALYGAAALALLYRFLTQSRVPLYVAAGFLTVPFGFTLDWLGIIAPTRWGPPFMGLASLYFALAVMPWKKLPVQDAHTLRVSGIWVSFLALACTALWVLTNWMDTIPDTANMAERLVASIAPVAASVWYGTFAYQGRSALWGYASAALLMAGSAIILDGLTLGPGGVALATVLGAAAYLGVGWSLWMRSNAPALRQAEDQGQRKVAMDSLAPAFMWPAITAGYGLAVLSFWMASAHLASGPSAAEVWPATFTYFANAGILGASAYVFRQPAFAHAALALTALPYTLSLNSIAGHVPAELALPSNLLAFGWTALAIMYLVGSVAAERVWPRYVAAAPVIAYLLLAGAAVASLGNAGRQSIVFGAIVLVAASSALLTLARATSLVPGIVSRFWKVTLEDARRYVALGYMWVASLLFPLWGLETLAFAHPVFYRNLPVQGLVLGIASVPYLALGVWLARRTETLLASPLYLVSSGMVALSIAFAFPKYGLSVSTLAIAAFYCGTCAYLFRGTLRSYLALWGTAELMPATLFKALSRFDLTDEWYGLVLAGLAIAYLVATGLWERWLGTPAARVASVARLPAPAFGLRARAFARPTTPFHATAFAFSLVAALLSWPEPGELAEALNIATLAVVALFYVAAALRWRAPYLLYPAVLFAIGGYGLALDRLQPQHLGLAMLPGSAVGLALGWLLYWGLGGRKPSYSALKGDLLSPTSPLAWAAPLLAAGYGGTLAAVAISLPNEGPRMATLLFAAGVSGLSLAIFRGRAWLYSLLVFAHGAYASALALQRLHLDGPVIGALFVPATIAMALGMATTLRKSAGKASRQDILTSWAFPFAIACLADAAISLFLAAQSDGTGLLVTATYAILAAAGAQLTQNHFLPYVSTGFTTAAVIFTSRLLGLAWSQSAVVWSVQGLLMWWGSQAAASRREMSGGLPSKLAIWAMPLRKAGVRLSWFAVAFVLGTVAFSLVEPGSLEGGRLLLGIRVLTGEPMQNATTVLAFLGLLYLGMAFVERRPVFAYLALGLLLASWSLQLLVFQVSQFQAYAIPAGLYLMAIAFFERRRSPGSLPALIEGSALLLMLTSAFWQSVVDDPSLAYALLLAVESVLMVLWGAANQSRLPFIGGVAAFIGDVLWQTGEALSGYGGAVTALIAGILIVSTVAIVEWKRQQIIVLGREWANRLNQWRW